MAHADTKKTAGEIMFPTGNTENTQKQSDVNTMNEENVEMEDGATTST